MTLPSSRLERIGQILAIAWFVNFAAFVGIAMAIGGDAFNGHAAAGRYYLSNHGGLTEVSHEVFLYSQIHCVIVWVLTAIVIPIGIGAWMKTRRGDSA